MVDVKTQTKKTKDDPRAPLREARRQRLRSIAGTKAATVKVYAANESIRQALRHSGGMRFRDTIDQAVEWPNDSFTARRIADGSVRTDGPGSGEQAEPDESLNAREQAKARSAKPDEKAGHKSDEKAEQRSASRQPPHPAA